MGIFSHLKRMLFGEQGKSRPKPAHQATVIPETPLLHEQSEIKPMHRAITIAQSYESLEICGQCEFDEGGRHCPVHGSTVIIP